MISEHRTTAAITRETWGSDIISDRPMGQWQDYRAGVIVPITEDEARHQFDQWRVLSDDRGAAILMVEQLWNEIDQLRSEIIRLRAAP